MGLNHLWNTYCVLRMVLGVPNSPGIPLCFWFCAQGI